MWKSPRCNFFHRRMIFRSVGFNKGQTRTDDERWLAQRFKDRAALVESEIGEFA